MRGTGWFAALLLLVLGAQTALGHGGSYQPPPGYSGPRSGGGGGGGPTSGGGVPQGTADAPSPVTAWETWWAANKDAYLRLGSRMRDEGTVTLAEGEKEGSAADAREAREALVREELVPIFLEALADESSEVRTAAAIALGKTGDPRGVAVLQKVATTDSHKDVRESAILGLGLLGRPQSIPFLDKLLRDKEAPARSRSFAAFGIGLVGGQEGVSALARFVDDRSIAADKKPAPPLVASVYFALGLTDREEAIPYLADALKAREWDDQVHAFIVLALGRLRDRSRLDEIARLMNDPNGGLRRAAAIALGRICDPKKDSTPLANLLDAVRNDSDPLVKHYAAVSLGALAQEAHLIQLRAIFAHADGDERGFLALALGLAHDEASTKLIRKALEKEKTERDRGAFSIALGLAGDTGARPLLEREAVAPGAIWSAGYAALALGMIGSVESAPILRKQLDATNDPRLRANLAIALGLLRDPKGEEWLRTTLAGDGTLYERAGGAMALGHLRRTRNVPALLDAYRRKRDHELVRAFSIVALGVIADPEDVPRLAQFRIDGDYSVSHDALNEAMSIY